jgi:hypothetical protein
MHVCGKNNTIHLETKTWGIFLTDRDWLVNEAARNMSMKVAINSTQKAELQPIAGRVVISSVFTPYTELPTYVADTEPTV